MHELTLYTRTDCHLCEDMKAIVLHVAHTVPLHLDVVDIGGRPDLEATYGLEVPVLFIDGRKAAKIRLTESQLMRKLMGHGQARRQD